MSKKGRNLLVYSAASAQIFLLVSMSFAVAFFFSENLQIASAAVGDTHTDAFGHVYTENADGTFTGTDGINYDRFDPPPSASPVPIVAAANPGPGKYFFDVRLEGSSTTQVGRWIGNENGIAKYMLKDGTVVNDINGKSVPDLKTAAPAPPLTEVGWGLPAPRYAGYSGVTTPLSKNPILVNSPVYGSLLEGLLWAGVAVGVVQLIGGIAGFDSSLTNTISGAVFGGIMAGKLVQGWIIKGAGVGAEKAILPGTKLTAGQAGVITFVIVAAAIFILTYKKESTKLVNFQCLPFEPALGGAKCEQCNKDSFRSCSEYRCKSLGQACQLLNPGTKEEKCSWVNPKDVTSPVITPDPSTLKPSDLKYVPDSAIRPPALGVKIVSGKADGCLPAFTPLEFGFTTNEPAQCKVDYNHTGKIDAMQYYFGESNYYVYNHTQKMRLPGPNAEGNDLSPLLRNDGSFALYTRCRDANGNENVDEYSFSFCIDESPDTTPPVIEGFSIPSGSYVTYNQDKVNIDVFVNEPSECKWSRESKSYEDMENSMQCATQSNQINANLVYTCSGNLTGVKNNEDNKYYFRCKDQPEKPENERFAMVQSKELILKGSQPLNIIKAGPNETITGSTDSVQVNLEAETSNGAEEGKAICYFSPSGASGSYIVMFETNDFKHKQPLSLTNGNYQYYFRCVDSGGNAAESNTTFNVFVDKQAPRVTRAYKQDALKIVTDENALCVYSLTTCNYNFLEGIKMSYTNPENQRSHYADWKPASVYYIKCRDGYGNLPDPNTCSIVVSAVELEKKSI